MATAVITIADCEDGQIEVTIDYGDGGAEIDSPAHGLATASITQAMEILKGAQRG